MIIEKHLRLFSGETLDIPDKLYEVIVAEKPPHQTTLELDNPENYLGMILNLPEGIQAFGTYHCAFIQDK